MFAFGAIYKFQVAPNATETLNGLVSKWMYIHIWYIFKTGPNSAMKEWKQDVKQDKSGTPQDEILRVGHRDPVVKMKETKEPNIHK